METVKFTFSVCRGQAESARNSCNRPGAAVLSLFSHLQVFRARKLTRLPYEAVIYDQNGGKVICLVWFCYARRFTRTGISFPARLHQCSGHRADPPAHHGVAGPDQVEQHAWSGIRKRRKMSALCEHPDSLRLACSRQVHVQVVAGASPATVLEAIEVEGWRHSVRFIG